MSEEILQKAKEQIDRAIDRNGPYSHNIIGLVLNDVSAKLGRRAANSLIEEFDLEALYGFYCIHEEK